MRKDKQSSYQAKKEKLQRIKHITETLKQLEVKKTKKPEPWIEAWIIKEIEKLWEIVKDE